MEMPNNGKSDQKPTEAIDIALAELLAPDTKRNTRKMNKNPKGTVSKRGAVESKVRKASKYQHRAKTQAGSKASRLGSMNVPTSASAAAELTPTSALDHASSITANQKTSLSSQLSLPTGTLGDPFQPSAPALSLATDIVLNHSTAAPNSSSGAAIPDVDLSLLAVTAPSRTQIGHAISRAFKTGAIPSNIQFSHIADSMGLKRFKELMETVQRRMKNDGKAWIGSDVSRRFEVEISKKEKEGGKERIMRLKEDRAEKRMDRKLKRERKQKGEMAGAMGLFALPGDKSGAGKEKAAVGAAEDSEMASANS